MKFVDPRIRLPKFMTRKYKGAFWKIESNEKRVYLTFDDGPIPEVTPWVLELLEKENIKACFFCVGENVYKNPEVYQQILDEGHQVGNHTFNHMQGMKNTDEVFFENIAKAAKYIDSKLFRPPHGLMKKSQLNEVVKNYKVIMWDILSRDFKKELSPEQVVKNVMRNVRPGSIMIFHDSLKAEKNMKQALPIVIKRLKGKGYDFCLIPE